MIDDFLIKLLSGKNESLYPSIEFLLKDYLISQNTLNKEILFKTEIAMEKSFKEILLAFTANPNIKFLSRNFIPFFICNTDRDLAIIEEKEDLFLTIFSDVENEIMAIESELVFNDKVELFTEKEMPYIIGKNFALYETNKNFNGLVAFPSNYMINIKNYFKIEEE